MHFKFYAFLSYSVLLLVSQAFTENLYKEYSQNDTTLDQPLNIAVFHNTSSSVLIKWEPPLLMLRNGFISNYSLTFQTKNQDNVIVVTNETFYFAEDLKKNAEYVLFVSAMNQNGSGPPANFNFTTMEDVPSAPTNVNVSDISSSAVLISWNEPLNPNGLILAYNLSYHKANDSRVVQLSYNGDIKSMNISSLAPGPVEKLTMTEVGANNILIKWLEPNITNGVVFYNVYYKIVDRSNSTYKLFNSGNLTSLNITGLEEYFIYEIAVQSYTTGGNGSLQIINATTLPTVPTGKPLNFTVSHNTSSAVLIKWEPPLLMLRNGFISNYSLTFQTKNQDNVTVVTNETFYFAEDLKKNAEYVLFVSAMNQNGSGPPANFNFTTMEDVPSAPTNVNVSDISSSAVLISWNEPLNPNGLILAYTLSYHKANDSRVVQLSYNGDIKSMNISSLAPGPVEELTVTEVGANNILIKWLEPNITNGVVFYNVYYKIVDGSNSTYKLFNSGNLTSLNITGLEEYFIYEIAVQSYTTGGNGSLQIINATTLPTVPTGKPLNFTVSHNTSSAVLIKWEPPLLMLRNGFISNYSLTFQTKNQDNVTVVTNETFYFAKDLKKNAEYVLFVSAMNQNGSGPPANFNFTTMEDVPSAPTNVNVSDISSSAVLISWNEPLNPNGLILAYNLSYHKANDSRVVQLSYNGDIKSMNISSLEAFSLYLFTLSANTSAGFGDEYNGNFTTAEGAPGPVEELTVTEVGANNILIKWLEPNITNGVVFYNVYYKIVDGSNSTYKLFNSGNLKSLNITGLEEYFIYEIAVQSYTTGGNGSLQIINATTLPTAPSGEPINLQSTTLSSIAIRLTWDHPDLYLRNGIIVGYEIVYNSSVDDAVTSQTNETFFTAYPLTKFAKYRFLVTPINQVGAGSLSAEVFNTTFQDVPGIPELFDCNTVSAFGMKLTWSLPKETNGIITNFRLRRYNNITGVHKETVYTNSEFKAVDNNLHPFTNYTYSLATSTKIGFGDSASITCQTLETKPGEPDGLKIESTGAFWFQISWKEPKQKLGVVLSYKCVVSKEESDDPFISQDLGLTFTFNATTQLVPFQYYTVRVYARTSIGYGTAARETVQTQESVPSSVENITHRDVTSTTFLLQWQKPLHPNGRIVYNVYKRRARDNGTADVLIMNHFKLNKLEIQRLDEYTKYVFSVYACTSVGCAAKKSIQVMTDSAVPNAAVELQNNIINSTAIQVNWRELPVEEQNGVIDLYMVKYVITRDGHTLSKNVTQTSVMLTSLGKYTQYRIDVWAHNEKGFGPSAFITATTKQDRPGPPELTGYKNITPTSIEVSWNAPKEPNGIITIYKLVCVAASKLVGSMKNFAPYEYDRSQVINDLYPFTLYNVSIYAHTIIGFGEGAFQQYMTAAASPIDPPTHFKAESKTATSITMSWEPPNKPNGNILRYEIEIEHKGPVLVLTTTKHKFDYLEPYTLYTFKIMAISDGGRGPYTSVRVKTDSTAPPLPPYVSPPETRPTDKTITLKLSKASDKNGVVSYYLIIVFEATVIPGRKPSDFELSELKVYEEYIEDRKNNILHPYIAAKILASHFPTNGTFIVGSGETTLARKRRSTYQNSFYNGPLIAETNYYVFQRTFVDRDKFVSSKNWDGPYLTAKTKVIENGGDGGDGGAIAGGIIAALVVIVIVAAALYYFRVKKLMQGKSSLHTPLRPKGNSNLAYTEEHVTQGHVPLAHPIKVENFPAHVQNLAKDGKYLFSEEYKLIQQGRTHFNCMYEHSNHPINRDKNRYHNIVAYDHTRLLLRPVEGIPESDYINANYIDGYMGQSCYIATQGPLESTCEDFWRMCWEQNVSTVVMLTRLIEQGKIKCHQYWPEAGSICYGMMQVTLADSLTLPSYTVRTFSLIHNEFPGTERFIRHFGFTSWPDHKTSNSQSLLSFIRHVNQGPESNSGPAGPIVVHCSAGVGRTGTYIELDVNLRRIKNEGTIEIFNFLEHIRTQRNYMVQTEAQYVFIHDTLNEFLTFGVTEVQVQYLREHIKTLQQPVQEDMAETNVDKEFHKLSWFDQTITKTFDAANAPFNKTKNRFLNVLPYDDTRVNLRILPTVQGSDYINANYVNGYTQTRQFIATQAPLPQTIPAFWRMVWEHHSLTIVCLAQETEGGKVKIHRYWPSIEAAMHGPLMIEQVSQKILGDFIIREFKVTHTTEGHSRNIKHFQYMTWPDNSYPENGSGLVDLIGHVQKWQQQNGVGQIVVHCSAGVGRTGVFMALCNMIEQVRIEGIVDVFQTVRELRRQRPAMVQTKAQYMFCYLALQDFLASFDIYQNFM